MSFWDDISAAEEREERKTAAMQARDEKLITDECRCASCRSDLAQIVPCEGEP